MTLYKYGRFLGEDRITLRVPPFSTQRWNRLCLPADYASNMLRSYHQKNAKTLGNPWIGGLQAYGHLDGSIGFILINSGSTVFLRFGNSYGTTEQTRLPMNSQYSAISNWSLDKVNKKFSFEFYIDNDRDETSPTVVADDGQTSFWSAAIYGSGSVGAPNLSDDTGTVMEGSNSLKWSIPSGVGAHPGVNHVYSPAQDWSRKEFHCLWWYGSNSGKTLEITVFNQTTPTEELWRWNVVENWSGWRRLVLPFNAADLIAGSPNLNNIVQLRIAILNADLNQAAYLDRIVVDTGQWVKVEVYIPDTLANGASKALLYSWNGSAYGAAFLEWNPEGAAHTTQTVAQLYFLDGTTADQIYTAENVVSTYAKGGRTDVKSALFGNAGSITYSSNYGCQKRIGFATKMPPSDGQDGSNVGISQCRLKLEVYYDCEGDATYEFENTANQYYGLQNINKQYLVLFKGDAVGVLDFLELKAGLVVNSLTVKANHNEEITEVVAGFSGVDNSKEMFWGQSDEDPATDGDTDGIPDVIENIESFVGEGGY